MKPIHVNTLFNGKRAADLETLVTTDHGKIKYSDMLRTTFDYYCENNPFAIEKLKENKK